jgi:hypothetical protein
MNDTGYYSICSAATAPVLSSDMPVDCTGGTNTFPITSSDCNSLTNSGINGGSPLICLIKPQLWISLDVFGVKGDGRFAGSKGVSDQAGQDVDHGVHGGPVA